MILKLEYFTSRLNKFYLVERVMAKDGYIKIYDFLINKFKKKEGFTLEEIAHFAGYKVQSIRVYNRNKLRDKFINEIEKNNYKVLPEIDSFSKNEFVQYLSQKTISDDFEKDKSDFLRENSINAMIAAIEIHNKPQFTYRYQVVIILLINSWELLFKSYIIKYYPKISIFQSDGSTKPFDQIMSCVIDQLGKNYFHIRENLKILYSYRCDFVHYYNESLDPLLFGLVQKSVLNYNSFINDFFKFKLESLADFSILPIGFKRPFSPIDYLTNQSSIENLNDELKHFLLMIIDKTKELNISDIQETILVPYSLHYKNENRLKNSDIVAAINQNKDINISISQEYKIVDKDEAKEVKIKEVSLFDSIYTESYSDIVTFCRSRIQNWKQNRNFNSHMKELKKDSNLHKIRFLDPNNPNSSKKDFYSKNIYEKLIEIYAVS